MLIRRLIAAAASVGLLAIAGPAFAAGPPYTIKVGTNTTGSYSVNFARVSGTPLTIIAGQPLNCTNVTASATTTAGPNMNPIFRFGTFSFYGCSFNGSAPTVTFLSAANFTGTGSNATTGNETIAGRIANFAVRISTGSVCRFDITGFANASFNETSQRLLINEVPASATVGNLTVSNVVGCGGTVQNGNKATFVATLATSSSGGAVNLS